MDMNRYYPQFNIFTDAFDVFKQHPHNDNDVASLYPEVLRRVEVHGNPTITNLGNVYAIGGVHGMSSLDDHVNPTDEYDMI